MIKNILFSFSLFVILQSSAQEKHSQAVALFVQAEESFSESNYEQTVSHLNKAIETLGSPNAKILYLKIRALEKIYTGSFNHTKDIDTSLAYFFRITKRSEYPEEKYLDILRINNFIIDFKSKDSLFYANARDKYQKKSQDNSSVKSSIESYLRSSPNTYYLLDLQKIVSEIDQKNAAVAVRKEKKHILKNRGMLSVLTIGYSVPMGNQKNAFRQPKKYSDIHDLFNGSEYPVGAKYRINASLFELGIPLFATSSVSMAINWTLFEGEYIKWNLSGNSVYYKADDYTGNKEYYEKIDVYRVGTKIGPMLSTGVFRNSLIFDFYYNARPGMYLINNQIGFDLTSNTANSLESYSIMRGQGIKAEDISVNHELGLKIRIRKITINPFYTFGKYTWRSEEYQVNSIDGDTPTGKYQMQIPYSFAGVNIGFKF